MHLKMSGNNTRPYFNVGISGYLYVAYTLLIIRIFFQILKRKSWMSSFCHIMIYWLVILGRKSRINQRTNWRCLCFFFDLYRNKKGKVWLQSTRILYNILSFVINENNEDDLLDFDNNEVSWSICKGPAGVVFVIHEIDSYFEVQSHEYFEK